MKLFNALRLGWLRLKNPLDYYLRQKLHLAIRPVDRPRIGTPDLIGRFRASRREKAGNEIERLTSTYHFDYFSSAHSMDEAKENFYYLSMLDKAFTEGGINLPDSVEVADIGPSSWFYVHALFAALMWHNAPFPRAVRLSAFEVDPYRLYADFHTRQDHALGNMRGLPNVEYFACGFTANPNTYNVITMFFPFVFIKDHLEWGLPERMFAPVSLLKDVWGSLVPGGALVIVNQGMKEHREQLRLLDSCAIPVAAGLRMDSLLYSYPLDRFVITAKK